MDELVARQVLRALEPAGLELSVQAVENIHRERERLTIHWKQQIERAQYDVRKAERHYRAVDPENRLVARTLEQEWEAALGAQRRIEEELDRFQRETPAKLTAEQQDQIRALATELPTLWHASTTTPADRKEIVRCLIERVVINIRGDTEGEPTAR
ncbi:MAG: hypothetical protein B7Z73_17555 [Planctomycetia bacterium 21-64-5]|nr:MAG: hypothetical protein B7Z73_17555 [Planctomycetia bacterium 21-64-5]HQU46072.1 hypothetical protein [Pirellulales bacterium]